ncbi:MAG: decarboxylase [Candidatus Woesearchaeota archaeon]
MNAYFELSKSIALNQFKIVQDLCNIVSYSSKTNPLITKILEENTNSLFSIHFKNELKHVKDKSRVLFLLQGTNEEELQEFLNQKITKFVVDNQTDLQVLLNFIEKTNEKITLLLRVKLKENTIRTEKYYVFGMDSEIVSKKILELKNHKNISSLGIHFHRKTQNMAEWNLIYELQSMFNEEIFKNINILNIGGGLPSEYANTNIKVFDSIYKKIIELKDFLNKNKINLMIEPGRFISAPAVKLHTEILAIHQNTIIINASVYNSDMDALIVPVKLLVENEKESGQSYVIKGKTPCSLDLFRYKVYLENPKVGDIITFLNAGAYNFTTNFCDLEEIPTKIID